MPGELLTQRHITAPAIRILILSASPSDTTRIALDHEIRQITRRLRATPEAARLELVHESAGRIADLQAALLRHKPTIVHFSGHGDAPAHASPTDRTARDMTPSTRHDSRGAILNDGEQGDAATVNAEALGDLLRSVGGVRCVILDAWFSAEQGEVLRRQADCVIGMTCAITDPAAIAFASKFYRALGFGLSVGTAFELGCNQIALEAPDQKAMPRLITRDGVSPSNVWLFSRAGHAPDREPARSRSETLTDCHLVRIQQHDNGRTLVMTLRGSLDACSSPTLSEYVDSILASQCREITVNLGELDLIDSSGLAVIVKIFKGMRSSNRITRFINARGQPLAFMRRLGMGKVFNL